MDGEIARLLREVRRVEGLTQLAMARRLGIGYHRYLRLERGISPFRHEEKRRLRRLVGEQGDGTVEEGGGR